MKDLFCFVIALLIAIPIVGIAWVGAYRLIVYMNDPWS